VCPASAALLTVLSDAIAPAQPASNEARPQPERPYCEIMMHKKLLTPRYLLTLSAIVLCLALWFLVGSGRQHKVQAAAQGTTGNVGAGRPPAPVVAGKVTQRDIPVQVTAIGNVEAYQAVQIKSMVNGQISQVLFKEGQDVRKGQLLFTLDKRPFEAELQKAIGTLQRDEAQAANSRAQAERYTALEKDGVIAHEQAEQQRAQAQADAAAVYADRATVNAARVQLQYTDIRAPIDARAGAVQINLGTVGNLVKANDTTYLVQLNQIQPIYTSFSIPERTLDEVRRYAATGSLKVLAYQKGQSTSPAEGILTFIDNYIDTQTGTVRLKATFPNQDRQLWPGEFVDVVLNLSTWKNAIVVPTKAIQTGQQGEYVYVITPQSTAESRPVTTSGTYQDLTLVTSGLEPGEQVVVNGQLRVAPNGKVIVQSTVPTTAEAANPAAGTPATGGGQ
jgi:multidrug efflux system membrane fusion protein